MHKLYAIAAVALLLTGCTTAEAATTHKSHTTTNTTQAPSTATQQSPVTSGNVEYAFTKTGQHPERVMVDTINAAKSTLDIAIYSLTQQDIVSAIVDARKRGVNVRVITDKTEAKTKSQSQALQTLIDTGIPVKENTHSGLMHMKVSVVDGETVTTGSFNYSESASTVNDEVLVVIHDANMARQWDAQFEQMWNDTKNFKELK